MFVSGNVFMQLKAFGIYESSETRVTRGSLLERLLVVTFGAAALEAGGVVSTAVLVLDPTSSVTLFAIVSATKEGSNARHRLEVTDRSVGTLTDAVKRGFGSRVVHTFGLRILDL